MQLYIPIKSREKTQEACGHCGLLQMQLEGLQPTNYLFAPKYLDNGLINCEKYFNEKYMVCENCGNITEQFHQDNTSYFEREDVQEILRSNITQTEKNFLIMHIIKNNTESLSDLYFLYEYLNNPERSKYYRDCLFQIHENNFNNCKSLTSLRMMMEFYRRDSEFDKALMLYKKYYKQAVKEFAKIDYEKKSSFEKWQIEEERKLCKTKNNKRMPQTEKNKINLL